MFENMLSEWMKWRLSSVARLGLQFDSISQMSSSHDKECTWVQVVQYELYVLGSPFVIIGIADRGGDAKLPVRTILHEQRSGVSVALKSIDEVLIGAIDDNRWGR